MGWMGSAVPPIKHGKNKTRIRDTANFMSNTETPNTGLQTCEEYHKVVFTLKPMCCLLEFVQVYNYMKVNQILANLYDAAKI